MFPSCFHYNRNREAPDQSPSASDDLVKNVVLINSRVVSRYVRNVRSVCPDGKKRSKEKNTSESRLTPKSELYDRNVNGLLGNWLVKKIERSKDEHAIRKLEQRLLDGFVCVYAHVTHSNHG